METIDTKPTQDLLRSLLKYSCGVKDESGRDDADPGTVCDILFGISRAAGNFEGLRLKGWGLISSEFEEVLCDFSAGLGLEISFSGSLHPPFDDIHMQIQHSGPGGQLIDVDIWKNFLAGLLSSYGMSPVDVTVNGRGSTGLELSTSRAVSSDLSISDSQSQREFVHDANNFLGGIMSSAGLVKEGLNVRENSELIELSARKLTSLIGSTFPKAD